MTKKHEHFRYCVYCGVDCYADPPEERRYDPDVEHAEDCPTNTGLYVVQEQDLKLGHGFGCCGCAHQFAIGEHYVLKHIDDHVGGVTCVSCAALDLAEA